jgi:hypothetical protein
MHTDPTIPDRENDPGSSESGIAQGLRFSQRGRRRAQGRSQSVQHQIDFDGINRAALAALPGLLARWLPGGRRQGGEYVAVNPRRPDARPGSFKINLRTGRWGDFAIEARGGDPVSLAAYLFDMRQGQAAREIARTLGLSQEGTRS